MNDPLRLAGHWGDWSEGAAAGDRLRLNDPLRLGGPSAGICGQALSGGRLDLNDPPDVAMTQLRRSGISIDRLLLLFGLNPFRGDISNVAQAAAPLRLALNDTGFPETVHMS